MGVKYTRFLEVSQPEPGTVMPGGIDFTNLSGRCSDIEQSLIQEEDKLHRLSFNSASTVETFLSADSDEIAGAGADVKSCARQSILYSYTTDAQALVHQSGAMSLMGQFVFVLPAKHADNFGSAAKYLDTAGLPSKPTKDQPFFMKYIPRNPIDESLQHIDFDWVMDNLSPHNPVEGGEYAIAVLPVFRGLISDVSNFHTAMLSSRSHALARYAKKFAKNLEKEPEPDTAPQFRH